jgi:hypothetical protein
MTSVKGNSVVLGIAWEKKGETLNMVPMGMRDQYVKVFWWILTGISNELIAEISKAGTRIENNEVASVPDLNAGRIGTVRPAYPEGEFFINESLHIAPGPELLLGRNNESGLYLLPDVFSL